MAVYMRWNEPNTKYLLQSPQGAVGLSLLRRAKRVQSAARKQVGVKSGKLRNSIHIRQHGSTFAGQKVSVGSNVKYALVHHEGSRPHVILPIQAAQLVFISRGRLIRTDRVNHPGTRANKYLSDNLREALIDINI